MLTLMPRRRKKQLKIIWYLVLIVVVSAMVIIALGRATDEEGEVMPKEEKVAEITPAQENKDERAEEGDVKEAEKKEEPKEEPTDEEQPSEEKVDFEGTEVQAAGFKIKVPKKWFFSFSNEDGAQLLNFGTQKFGPDNAYNFTMTADASGYISPIEKIPAESIGGLVESSDEKTNDGLLLKRKVFMTNVEGAGEVVQILYTFELDSKKYGAILWTAASNDSQVSLLSDMVKTIRP